MRLLTARSFVRKLSSYSIGESISGFTIRNVTPVKELQLVAVELQHNIHKSPYLHVDRDDSNNAFSVQFRTTPFNNTGVAHILEHLSLCGSKNYQCRDPFFKMLSRSLATFLNAMTSSDWTMYPFSTCNRKDYFNLLNVYLDASFFPLLRKRDFMQEGWRLEHENVFEKQSPIQFKGVVFNEMKGAFSTQADYFELIQQNELLPDSTYGYCAGGKPLDIPKLSWEELCKFHQSHYHPSNASFYSYGNFNLQDIAKHINEKVMQNFPTASINTNVAPQKCWHEPKVKHVRGPYDAMSDPKKQSTVSVSYLINSIDDTYKVFCWQLLSHLLTYGAATPFYEALLKPNIGSSYSPSYGYSKSTRDCTFSIGLQSIAEVDIPRVIEIIESTIDKVIKEGFSRKRIDAVLHQTEISVKHQSASFGLYLGLNLADFRNHNVNLSDAIQVNHTIQRFIQDLDRNPQFLQEMVENDLKRNKHKLVLSMTGDKNFADDLVEEEKIALNSRLQSMDDAEKLSIYDKGVELFQAQEEKDDVDVLPSIEISDIDPLAKDYTIPELSYSGPTMICKQPTNEMCYFRAVFPINNLHTQYIPYIRQFASLLTKMGAGKYSFSELAEEVELSCGGLSAGVHISPHHTIKGQYQLALSLSSSCLEKNFDRMMELWTIILNEAKLNDKDRLVTLLRNSAHASVQSLHHQGHVYAMSHAASGLSQLGHTGETISGITQVAFLKKIVDLEMYENAIESYEKMAPEIINTKNMRAMLTSTPTTADDFSQRLTSYFSQIPGDSSNHYQDPIYVQESSDQFMPTSAKTHFLLESGINHIALALKAVPYTHSDFPAIRTMSHLMTWKYLHKEIREKGGAYGGGSKANADGTLNFFSYRDPNLMKTLDAFKGAISFVKDGNFSQRDVDEAKLSAFQQIDHPLSPSNRGLDQFHSDITKEQIQENRDRMISLTRDDLIDAANRHLPDDLAEQSVTVLGAKSDSTSSKEWVLHPLQLS